MIKIFHLALRNISRNRRRTVISVIMIGFGIIVTTFVSGFLGFMSDNLVQYLIESDTGEIKMMAKGYKEEQLSGNLDYTIKQKSLLMSELQSEEEISSVTAKIAVGGLLSNGQQTVYCNGTAVNYDQVKETLPMLLTESSGSNRKLKLLKGDGAILGTGLAEKLKVNIGDTIFLVSYDQYGGMNAVDLTITDIAQYSTDVENDMKIIMTFGNAAVLYGLEDQATEFSIRIKDQDQVSKVVNYLQEKYGEEYQVEFYSWQDLMGSYGQTIGMFQAVQLVILLIMAAVVLIGVVNTILMSVFERVKEIGTLRALGTSRKRITALFLAESFWIGLIGSIVGVLLGLLFIYLANIKGIPFAAPGTTQTFYIKPVWQQGMFILSALVLIFVSIIAGIYPARYAAKLDPVEAIRRA